MKIDLICVLFRLIKKRENVYNEKIIQEQDEKSRKITRLFIREKKYIKKSQGTREVAPLRWI